MSEALSDAAAPPPLAHPPPARRRPFVVIAGLLLLALCAGGFYVVTHWGKESTDNAFVEGHVVSVGARIPGTVSEVLVVENQVVHKGDALVRLDDADQQVKVRVAEADLAAAQAARDAAEAQLQALTGNTAALLTGASAGVDGARAATSGADAAVAQAKAALESAQARATQAAADRARGDRLVDTGGISKQALEALVTADVAAQAALAQAQAGLAAAQQGAVGARERLEEARARYAQATTGDAQVQAAAAQLRAADARLDQAEAGLEAAELALSYTEVVAPFDAVVARRGAEPGQVVGAGTALVGLVGTSEVWVTANFKETQVARMVAGQEVDVEVDGLPGESFEGKVQGVSGASGARFSLLPPDNASGNFTKVVQRFPVRIDLGADAVGKLRPGMSAVVTVHVR